MAKRHLDDDFVQQFRRLRLNKGLCSLLLFWLYLIGARGPANPSFLTLEMTPTVSVTALSAPGKVLLTGGYLCLDRAYTGTVFALNARIHVVVEQLQRAHRRGATGEEEDSVIVRSPQFLDAVWEYGVQQCDNGGGVKVVQKGDRYEVAS